MASHYSEAIREAEMAELWGLSPHRFCRGFREELGVTFQAHLVALRLERAKALLANPSVPVPDVAYTVGFTSPSSVARAFRGAFAVSPSDFRARAQTRPAPLKRGKPVPLTDLPGQSASLAAAPP